MDSVDATAQVTPKEITTKLVEAAQANGAKVISGKAVETPLFNTESGEKKVCCHCNHSYSCHDRLAVSSCLMEANCNAANCWLPWVLGLRSPEIGSGAIFLWKGLKVLPSFLMYAWHHVLQLCQFVRLNVVVQFLKHE